MKDYWIAMIIANLCFFGVMIGFFVGVQNNWLSLGWLIGVLCMGLSVTWKYTD